MAFLKDIALPINGDRHAYDVLQKAEHCWTNLSKFRKERRRCIDYAHGNQWNDVIIDGRGRPCREKDVLLSQGQAALVQNMISKTVNVVQGLFINSNSEAVCTARDREEQAEAEGLTKLLQYTNQINKGVYYNSQLVREAIISGFIGTREVYGWNDDRLDCWSIGILPDNFFVDTEMNDPRGWDCTLCGEIHDMPLGELLNSFATSPEQVKHLKTIYNYATNEEYLTASAHHFGFRKPPHGDFLIPSEVGMCRVIEVWNKEYKPRYHYLDNRTGETFKCNPEDRAELVDKENKMRKQSYLLQGVAEEEIEKLLITPIESKEGDGGWFMDSFWYFRWYAPNGEVLYEGETPYEHKKHPFVFKFYPFVNSEIHSFVSDMIDTQRYINRLINLNDYLIRTSAKGLLAVPDYALEGTGMTIEDLADVWAQPGGVYVYHAKAGMAKDAIPTQISNATQNIGLTDLISLEKSFFDDITGVNGALQGKNVGSVSGTYYAQQTQNAAVSLQSLLTFFTAYFQDVAEKRTQLIQQYYDEKRIEEIIGRDGTKLQANPNRIKNIQYDIAFAESQASPVFRQMANEFLMQAAQAGWVSFNTLLEAGNFPNADKIKQLMDAEKEQMKQEEQEMAMMQQVQQGGNMNAPEQGGIPTAMEDGDQAKIQQANDRAMREQAEAQSNLSL